MKLNFAAPILLTFTVALFCQTVVAEDPSLDAWQRVKGVDGCSGIPYIGLARKCMDTMVDVNESCKQVKWSCEDVPSLKGNEEEAYNRRKRADDLESNLAKVTDKEELKKMKTEIEEQRKKAAEAEERAKGAKKELELRRGFGNDCIKLRKNVQVYFRDTMDRADRESSSFSPEIKAIYEQKKGPWKDQYDKHEKHVDLTKAGVDACERKLDRRD